MQQILYTMPVNRDYVRMTQRKRLNRDYEILVQVTNDIFMSKITDAIDELKKSDLYKHEIKQAVNALDKSVKAYSRYFNRRLVNPSAFTELASNIEDYINNDMQLLRISIKSALDKRKTREADLYTTLEFAICIGCMATALTDNIAANHCYTVEILRPAAVMRALSRVTELMRCKVGNGIDLRVDNDVTNFIQKLALMMCDSRVYTAAMDETEKQ